jgi:hypothetical protein
MPTLDLEACSSFVYANRLAAALLKAKAHQLLETLQALDETESKECLRTIARNSLARATQHERLAELQERDMGVRCHFKTYSSIH